MQRELIGRHVVFGDRVIKQWPEQSGAFGIGDAPADNAAAEGVEDHIGKKVVPFGWFHQLGDVPGSYLVGASGQKVRHLIGTMAKLLAAFANFAVLGKQTVHDSDRAVIGAFVERVGVDFGWSLIGKAWRDSRIAAVLETGVDTVARARQGLVEEGVDPVLTCKHSPASVRKRIFDGDAEAKPIALVCSKPPPGRAKWT